MKRREFIITATAATVELVLRRKTLAMSGPKRRSRPNILFIMTDQQHAGLMSCTGNKWLKTPAMDRLAASGIRFERAYASNPVCLPSRFSLQTGLMPSAVGIRWNNDTLPISDTIVQKSLGNLFQRAGYETVYGGKVHLPRKMRELHNLGYRNLTRDKRQDLADSCVKFIKGQHTKPFLLFASFINPHDICFMPINDNLRAEGKPICDFIDSRTCEVILNRAHKSGDVADFVGKHCPPLSANHEIADQEPECISAKYLEMSFRDVKWRSYVRENWTETDWRLYRYVYRRLTEMVDEKIGQVLDAVRDAGLEDNTLIIFTSDHGDVDGAHKLQHKSVLYEESVRIPFIMSYKGAIPNAMVDDTHLVSNGLDLVPTLCDYAGIEPPKGLRGRSLRSLAEGKATKQWRDFVVSESRFGRMLRTDRFKYSIYDSGKYREQLIDLKEDPGEMNNLAEIQEFKDILNKHRQLLHEWVKQNNDSIAAEYIIAKDSSK